LRRLGVEDFVMVGDEKREKIESYGGTSTEVYVNVCCWRKLIKWTYRDILRCQEMSTMKK
jgi:hypothetical protein